jgi:hypothetical protein
VYFKNTPSSHVWGKYEKGDETKGEKCEIKIKIKGR